MALKTRGPFQAARNNAGVGERIYAGIVGQFNPFGNVFFVCSATTGAADSAGRGQTVDQPLATLDYAIGLCTAAQGDVIIVLPGHAETITGAAGVALDISGVTIIGLGNGRNRPTFTFTTADAASFDISAANCRVEGLVFLNARDGQTAMMNITAADVTVRNCEFRLTDLEATSTTQAALGILASDAADRLIIEDLHMHGEPATGVTSAISYGACDNVVIRNNRITGNHATNGSIANTAAAVGGIIDGNFIVNTTADGNNMCIVLHASTNSLIANNRLAVIDSTSPIPITAAGGYISANYITGAAGVTASVLK